jgi:hypothetical protein
MNPMKNRNLLIASLLVLLIIPFSCKKFIQQQEQNYIVDLVTKGTWRITGYLDHQTNNITDSFAGYSFQFNKDQTLYSTKFGQQTYGTWVVDVSKKSITTNFQSATYPITMLNYTWIITDSYTDSVAAKSAVDSSFNILNLHKN